MIERILIDMYNRGDGKRRLAPAKKGGWRMNVLIVREFTGDADHVRNPASLPSRGIDLRRWAATYVAAPAGGIVVLNKAMIIPTWMTRT